MSALPHKYHCKLTPETPMQDARATPGAKDFGETAKAGRFDVTRRTTHALLR